jgi:hypothetical protein
MNLFSRSLPLLVAIATFVFIASVPKIQSATNAETDLAKKDACDVCHNGKNPHTVSVPCNKLAAYLVAHPGDYEGPCTNVTAEKPPKPTPKPKP